MKHMHGFATLLDPIFVVSNPDIGPTSRSTIT
jgi:hypothetical protein